MDEINRLTSDRFFVEVEIGKIGPNTLSGKMVRDFLESHLSSVDPSALSYDEWEANPQWHFQANGWHIGFRPFAHNLRRPSPKGVLGISGPMEAHKVLTREALRKAVRRKAGRYGNLSLPYVIAVLDATDDRADFVDLMDALFGDEGVRYPGADLNNPQPIRAPNGAWHTRRPFNTRNSAVLFVTGLTPWSVAESQAVLVHNPYAQRPYVGALEQVWQSVPDNPTGEMREVPGLDLATILGLPAGWPGSD
jgi:hypothetical protein